MSRLEFTCRSSCGHGRSMYSRWPAIMPVWTSEKNRHYTGHRHYSTACLSNAGTGNTEGLRFVSNAGTGITDEWFDMYCVLQCTHSQGNNTASECCMWGVAKHHAAEHKRRGCVLGEMYACAFDRMYVRCIRAVCCTTTVVLKRIHTLGVQAEWVVLLYVVSPFRNIQKRSQKYDTLNRTWQINRAGKKSD